LAEAAVGLLALEQAPAQRSKFLVRQGGKLQEPGVKPLELALRHRVDVDASNSVVGTRALQPPEQDLGGTTIGDRALAQTTFDLRVSGAHG
jgi:hypothetical protein